MVRTRITLKEYSKPQITRMSLKQLFFYFVFLLNRITAKIDDDMLSYYCNEDIFLLEVRQLEEDLFDITLTELSDDLNGK